MKTHETFIEIELSGCEKARMRWKEKLQFEIKQKKTLTSC